MSGPFPNYGSPDMMVLEGAPALSPFRRERLESRLQSIAPSLRISGAWHVYFVQPEGSAAPDLATLCHEAALFAANRPLTLDELGALDPDADAAAVRTAASLSSPSSRASRRVRASGSPVWPRRSTAARR